MKITCPNCGTSYHLRKELITPKGLKLVCKKCGHAFVVKLKEQESEPPKRVEREEESKPEKEKEATRPPSPIDLDKDIQKAQKAVVREDEPLPIITPPPKPPPPKRSWPPLATYLLCIAIIAACGGWIRWRSYKNWRDAAVELAHLYKSHGYLHEALLSLRNSLEEHPDSPEVNYQMGELLYLLDRRKEAIPFFKKALQNGGFPQEVKGSLMILAGELDGGIAWLSERMEGRENETQGMLLNDRAIGEVFAHKEARAWGDLKKAEKLWPSPVPRFNLGTLALQQADGPSCVRELEALRQEFPGNPLVLNNLSLCYALLGEKDKAIFLLNSALDHSIYNPFIWKNLAILTGNQLVPIYKAEADEIGGEDLAPIPYVFAFSWQVTPGEEVKKKVEKR